MFEWFIVSLYGTDENDIWYLKNVQRGNCYGGVLSSVLTFTVLQGRMFLNEVEHAGFVNEPTMSANSIPYFAFTSKSLIFDVMDQLRTK